MTAASPSPRSPLPRTDATSAVPPAPRRGARTLVLSGPSGAGKTSVAETLMRDPRFARARTATTRPPREGERDGVDYDFWTAKAFAAAAERGDLLEHAEVYGHRYGTPRRNLDAVLSTGRHCLLVVDVQGARTLRGMGFPAFYAFVDVPHPEELRRRIEARGLDGPETVRRRLEAAERERAAAAEFDLVVINDDREAAARHLAEGAGVEWAPRGEGT